MLLGSTLAGAVSGGSGTTSMGSVTAYLRADLSDYQANIKKAQLTMAGFATKASHSLMRTGAAFKALGVQAMLLGGVITGVVAGMTSKYVKFENAMIHATSISKVTDEQFAQMSLAAEKASIRLNLAASETASAFYHLGLAGLNATEQLEAYDTVVNFARLSGMSMSRTTEIMVNIMRGMHIPFKDVSDTADLMTATIISSNQSLSALGSGMSMVAALAYEIHTPLSQVAAAFGLMANAGIKGTRAGTAMRRAFANLMAPSSEMTQVLRAYNIQVRDGNKVMRPWIDIVMEMSGKLAGVDEAQRDYVMATLLGVRALTGQLAVFRDHGKVVEAYEKTLRNAAGSLELVLNKQMASLKNQFGSLIERGNMLYRHIAATLVPSIEALIAPMGIFVERLTEWVNLNPVLTTQIIRWTAVLGLGTLAFGAISLSVGVFMRSLSSLLTVFSVLVKGIMLGFSGLLGPAGIFILLGVAAYTLRAAWNQNVRDIQGLWKTLLENLKSGLEWLKSDTVLGATLVQWVSSFGEMFNELRSNFADFLIDIAGMWQGSIAWLKKVGTGIANAWEAPTFYQMIDDFKSGFAGAGLEFSNAFITGTEAAATSLAKFQESIKSAGSITAAVFADFKEAAGPLFSDVLKAVTVQFGEDMDRIFNILKERMPALVPMFKEFYDLVQQLKDFKLPTLPTAGAKTATSTVVPGTPSEGGKPMVEQPWWYRGIQQYSDDIEKEWPILSSFMADQMLQTAETIRSSMADAFTDVIANAKSMSDALSGFIDGIRQAFAKMLAEIAAQQLMKAATMTFLGAFPGFANKTPGVAAPGTPAPVAVIGHNGIPMNYVPPRLHKGLAPDEFPAILQRGEEVVPKGGRSMQQAPSIHNEIRIINQTSTPVTATQSTQQVDLEHMVTTIIMKDSRSYGPLKRAGAIG